MILYPITESLFMVFASYCARGFLLTRVQCCRNIRFTTMIFVSFAMTNVHMHIALVYIHIVLCDYRFNDKG